ncbi:CCA tRNA nucleotidyltransferase [candidate division WOR-3 bacterium]|nr:CCA tRNA nucleotidyltransferase [candidate division WOR-3 bacterium]
MARSRSSAKNTKKSVLNKTIDFFTRSPYHAYLVGGYVRDTTLGIQPIDIDIVVEGDAIKVSRDLNKILKGELTTYRDFRTASLLVSDQRIDLVSARIERYPEPAKLPHVYPSTINEDLNRRDFTINAIAMSISRENFGEIFDPFNGLGDIKRGAIRVLHKNSFIDDPTRIFRALRYKNRFGFKLEKTTRQLLQEAVSTQLIERLSGQRLLNEIRLIFQEPAYDLVVRDVSECGIFRIRKRDHDTIVKLPAMGFYYYLAAIDMAHLPLTAREHKYVHDFRSIWKIIGNLDRAQKKSAYFRILDPLSPQIIECIGSIRVNCKPKIAAYLNVKKKKRFITGDDLNALGYKNGQLFKKILTQAWYLQLDGKIKNKKEALALAKRMK